MFKVLYFTTEMKPELMPDGVWCKPIPYKEGYYLPLGWEEELKKKKISFEKIEIQTTEP